MKEKEKNLDWLKHNVSEELKNKIFAQAIPELEINKKKYAPQGFSILSWVAPGFLALALVAIVGIRLSGELNLDTATTSFDEIALLTPEEFEIVDNLDILEELDDIDLDEIRKEMKQKGGHS